MLAEPSSKNWKSKIERISCLVTFSEGKALKKDVIILPKEPKFQAPWQMQQNPWSYNTIRESKSPPLWAVGGGAAAVAPFAFAFAFSEGRCRGKNLRT